jgi:acyl-CoA synthetase (AMP-forming)/AMP-acid ligase II
MTQTELVPPIGTQISALAALAPDEPAVSCDGLTITRSELDRSTNRLARAYAERGVGVGDYVTIVLPNSVEWVQAAVACWKLGAVPQPLSPRLPNAELEGLLGLRTRALLVGGEDPRGEIASVPAGFTPDPAISDEPLPEAVSPSWKSLASGGSTGRPKLIEAGGDSRVQPMLGYGLGAAEGDTTLVPVPLSHNTGMTTASIALLMGHHLVLAPRFWELYGGTELQALTFISGDQWLAHPGSVGIVVSGEMKVLDDDGNPCPPGVVGEIYMRPAPGSAPTYRYLGSTAKSRDGWDSLGDLGYFDADGFLYLSDRRVDMFTVGGHNVYPAEIENALSAHPDVLSCLVVGVPDPNAGDLGQVPYALAHTAEGSALDGASVQDFLRERLASYKVPYTVEFVDTPLRDDAGKARRSAVRTEIMARLQVAEPG